jgi:hypothetical protein
MKRFEKYHVERTCGGYPERFSIMLNGREVAEIYVRDGEMELRGDNYATDHTDIIWQIDIRGWGNFDATERDHYMHEAVRRADLHVDPDGLHGKLDPDEPVPEIEDIAPDPEL